VPIYAADLAARAVALPAGRHRVELRYRAPGLRVGAALSLAGLGALVALVALRRRLPFLDSAARAPGPERGLGGEEGGEAGLRSAHEQAGELAPRASAFPAPPVEARTRLSAPGWKRPAWPASRAQGWRHRAAEPPERGLRGGRCAPPGVGYIKHCLPRADP
jgi:hypothetical protein